jgi:hypothetical protein
MSEEHYDMVLTTTDSGTTTYKKTQEWLDTYTEEQFCMKHLGGLSLAEVQEILKRERPEAFV